MEVPRLERRTSIIELAKDFSDEQLSILEQLFIEFDEDKDGSLNKKELSEVIKSLNVHQSQEEFEHLFRHLDINRDGKVSRSEFLKGIKYIQKAISMTKEKKNRIPTLSRQISSLSLDKINTMKELFKMCDTNKDGLISKEDLLNVMHQININPSKEDFDELWGHLQDPSRPHKGLTFEEFLSGTKWIEQILNIITIKKKGFQLREMNENAKVDLKKQKEMLQKYIQDLVENASQVIAECTNKNQLESAKMVAHLLDYELIKTLEEFVGPITSSSSDKKMELFQKSLQTKK